jgi:hypothetical protein
MRTQVGSSQKTINKRSLGDLTGRHYQLMHDKMMEMGKRNKYDNDRTNWFLR